MSVRERSRAEAMQAVKDAHLNKLSLCPLPPPPLSLLKAATLPLSTWHNKTAFVFFASEHL